MLLLALGQALLGRALALGVLDLLKDTDRTADREGPVLGLHGYRSLRRLRALAACSLANLLEGCVGHFCQCDCLQSLNVLLVGLEVASAQGTQVLEGAWTLELRQLRHLDDSFTNRLGMRLCRLTGVEGVYSMFWTRFRICVCPRRFLIVFSAARTPAQSRVAQMKLFMSLFCIISPIIASCLNKLRGC